MRSNDVTAWQALTTLLAWRSAVVSAVSVSTELGLRLYVTVFSIGRVHQL